MFQNMLMYKEQLLAYEPSNPNNNGDNDDPNALLDLLLFLEIMTLLMETFQLQKEKKITDD